MTYQKWSTPDGGSWTYADGAPEIRPVWTTLENLARANRDAGYRWFDADTLRWFGSQRRELVAGCVVVELQRNAPEGMGRYVAVPFLPDGSSAGVTCRHETRNAARKCAREIAAQGFHETPNVTL